MEKKQPFSTKIEQNFHSGKYFQFIFATFFQRSKKKQI